MDPQRLASHLRELGGLLNRTRACAVIEVAQTARRETHSGFVFGLEESERADPERKEDNETPRGGKTRGNEDHNKPRGERERDVAEPSAPRLAPRADIRDGGDG
jgi:hypothetical protein